MILYRNNPRIARIFKREEMYIGTLQLVPAIAFKSKIQCAYINIYTEPRFFPESLIPYQYCAQYRYTASAAGNVGEAYLGRSKQYDNYFGVHTHTHTQSKREKARKMEMKNEFRGARR